MSVFLWQRQDMCFWDVFADADQTKLIGRLQFDSEAKAWRVMDEEEAVQYPDIRTAAEVLASLPVATLDEYRVYRNGETRRVQTDLRGKAELKKAGWLNPIRPWKNRPQISRDR